MPGKCDCRIQLNGARTRFEACRLDVDPDLRMVERIEIVIVQSADLQQERQPHCHQRHDGRQPPGGLFRAGPQQQQEHRRAEENDLGGQVGGELGDEVVHCRNLNIRIPKTRNPNE